MANGKGLEEIFSMQESIEDLNKKTVGGGGYAIPREYIIQKYLKERINPKMPTTAILAALDQRKWEEKQVAEQQGPQQSVLEETISETETVMAPRMPQGINQGQPSPMPGQMPRQMAGLNRLPMPGRVPPQRNNGIPVMAAAGGYVPNFADGGIIGYKERGFVSPNRGGYNTSDFLPLAQEYNNKYYGQPGDRPAPTGRYSKVGEFFRNLTSPDTLEERSEKDIGKTLQLLADEELTLSSGAFDQITDTERVARNERLAELKAIKTDLLAQLNPESVTEKDGTKVNPATDSLAGNANNKIGENQGAVGIGPGTNDDLKSFRDSQNNMTEEEYQAFLDKQGPRDIINDGAGDIITDDELVKTLYGPEGRPEIETVESFKDRLTGEGSAFAKEQATTKEFRDDLNKRADKAMMSTDELMLRAGLGLMSSDKPAGRELQAIGEVGTGLTNEFIKRGDKADSIRDKARMLDTQLNKAESALDLAAEKFGVNSKQHREKTRQFEKVYVQREKLADQISGDKRYVSDKTLKATQIKNTIEDRRLLAKDVNDAKVLFLTKDDSAQRNINTVLNNPKFDVNLPQYKPQYDTAKRYLQYMKSIHNNNPSGDWKRDPELMELEKKLNRPSISSFEG